MRLVVVTGMSGAGKSSVLKMLEDAGYFCVDNLPVPLILTFAELTRENKSIKKVALGIDIRNGQTLENLEPVLLKMNDEGYDSEILFLEADDEVLIKRYKETRRSHPLSFDGRIYEGIAMERKLLKGIKDSADCILDTSYLLIRDLKAQIDNMFILNGTYHNFFIMILSFGFKYGIPIESDLVFDVRFLPNPYYLPELKTKTGMDAEVRDFVMQIPQSIIFIDKLKDMLNFLIPNYITEGKNKIVISIGCTGGKHRSVTLSNELANHFLRTDYSVKVDHRDIKKD